MSQPRHGWPREAGWLDRLRQSTVQVKRHGCSQPFPFRLFVQSHLPMWSSPGRPWPSSSCVRGGWRALGDGATRWSASPHREAGKQADASRRT